jgi:AGCS family alanine or glycine:cation symporter
LPSFSFVSLAAISLVKGDYSDPSDAGEVSHFPGLRLRFRARLALVTSQALRLLLASVVRCATFWMILAGLLGMASKFTRCTLGVCNNTLMAAFLGGPMYYISKGSTSFRVVRSLRCCSPIFCILGALGGNMFQTSQAAHHQITGDFPGWIPGLIFAIVVFAVIVGGIKSIAKVTERSFPFMGILYVGAALIVLIVNYDQIGSTFGQSSPVPLRVLVLRVVCWCLDQGFKRAAFSNEAGVGSAAIAAHSAVKTKEPITGASYPCLVLIDTVVICTMTALVIVTISGQLFGGRCRAGVYLLNGAGTAISTVGDTSGVPRADVCGRSAISWFPFVLAIAVILFAFSTMISWSYYGLKAWTYLFSEGKTTELVFKIIFCIFIVINRCEALVPSSTSLMRRSCHGCCEHLLPVLPDEGPYVQGGVPAVLESGEIKKYQH